MILGGVSHILLTRPFTSFSESGATKILNFFDSPKGLGSFNALETAVLRILA